MRTPPVWNFDWNWIGAVPNYDRGGVYALFAGEKLLYIGKGVSRGGGLYVNRGLSARLQTHVCKVAPPGSAVSYVPRPAWAAHGLDLIATLGFDKDRNYLAHSLESFLISNIDTPENQNR